jgi:hypothetical protein
MDRTAAAVGLSDGELASIAVNAFRRAFAPRDIVAPLLDEAVRAWEAWRGGDAIS